MATDKRFIHALGPPTPDKTDEAGSLAIHLPTTSATDHDDNPTDRNNNNSSSRQQATTHHSSRNLLNYCSHQAATRGVWLSRNHHQLNHHHSSERLTEAALSGTVADVSVTPPPHYHDIPGVVPAYQGRTSGPPPAYDDVVNPNAPPPSYQSLFGQVREARKTSNGLVDLFRQLLLILIGTIGCTMIIGFLLLIPITMILVGIVYVNDCRAENIPKFLVIGGFVWIMKNILNCYNQFKKDSSTVNRPPPRRQPMAASNNNNLSHRQPVPRSSSASVLIVSTGSNDTNSSSNNSSTNVIAITTNHSQSDSSSTSSSTASSPTSSATSNNSTTATTTSTTATRTTREQNIATSHIRQPPMIGLTSFKCESILNYFLIVWFLAGCIVVYRIYEPDYDNPLSASYCNRTVYLYAFWLMTSAFILMAIVLSCLCCLMVSSLMSCNHGR